MMRIRKMMKRVLFLLLTALITLPLYAQEKSGKVILPEKSKFRIILLAGQSNMAGRGFIQPEDKIAAPRVLTMNQAGKWIPSVEPTHFDKKSAGTCFGRTFAIRLAESDPTITVGIVPAACGGTSIMNWEPGQYYSPTKSYPFDDAISRTKKALAVGTLTAILWHQGESDCRKDHAEKYHDQLLKLFQTFRKEFNAPDVPILIGALYPRSGQYFQIVTNAQKQIASECAPAAYVTVDGIKLNPDKVHFDRESLIKFGNACFEKYQEITQKKIKW